MPAQHLRELIALRAPGRSVRELTAAAGVPHNRLAYWLKPGTKLTRMPTLAQLQELARIVGCETGEVHDALRRDVDGAAALSDGLADDEHRLLAVYRQLTAVDRERLRQIAHVLHGE